MRAYGVDARAGQGCGYPERSSCFVNARFGNIESRGPICMDNDSALHRDMGVIPADGARKQKQPTISGVHARITIRAVGEPGGVASRESRGAALYMRLV